MSWKLSFDGYLNYDTRPTELVGEPEAPKCFNCGNEAEDELFFLPLEGFNLCRNERACDWRRKGCIECF